MITTINTYAAGAHLDDLRRVAELRRAGASVAEFARTPKIELRLAHDHEADVTRRIAAMDDAPELAGQVLLALVNGEAVAGMSLSDERIVANPFVPTAEAISLLRLRAEHLSPARARRRARRILRPRLA